MARIFKTSKSVRSLTKRNKEYKVKLIKKNSTIVSLKL